MTAPLSQNGFDNSGRNGSIQWQQGDSTAQTLTAIQNLADRYAGDTDVVAAIELLNEPANWGIDMDALKQFYYDGWGNVRNQNGYTAVVIHDAFEDIQSYWNGFMSTGSGLNNVILDTHIYQIFSGGELAMKPCDHVQTACASASHLAGTDKWTIVGEWTGAQTDCAKWLNGLGKVCAIRWNICWESTGVYGDCQTKYEGTVDGLLDVDKVNLEYYVEAQLDAYEAHSGWIFWAWKTESAPRMALPEPDSSGIDSPAHHVEEAPRPVLYQRLLNPRQLIHAPRPWVITFVHLTIYDGSISKARRRYPFNRSGGWKHTFQQMRNNSAATIAVVQQRKYWGHGIANRSWQWADLSLCRQGMVGLVVST